MTTSAALGGVADTTRPKAIRLMPRACSAAIRQEILAAAACERPGDRPCDAQPFQWPLPMLGLALMAMPALVFAHESPHGIEDESGRGGQAHTSVQTDSRWQQALARPMVLDDDWGLSASARDSVDAAVGEYASVSRMALDLAVHAPIGQAPRDAFQSGGQALATPEDPRPTASASAGRRVEASLASTGGALAAMQSVSVDTIGDVFFDPAAVVIDGIVSVEKRGAPVVKAIRVSNLRVANIRAANIRALHAGASNIRHSSSPESRNPTPPRAEHAPHAQEMSAVVARKANGQVVVPELAGPSRPESRLPETALPGQAIAGPSLPGASLPEPRSPMPLKPEWPVAAESQHALLRRRHPGMPVATLVSMPLHRRVTQAHASSSPSPDIVSRAQASSAGLCEEPQHALETAHAPQVPGATAAQTMVVDAPPATGSALPLRAYRYIPSATEHEEVQRPPEEQRLIDLNLDGDYPRLAREGKQLIEKRGQDGQQIDDQLRLVIANALAWSGQLRAAEQHYRRLEAGTFALDAKVAMANLLRWRGKDDEALKLYREVLTSMPDHAEALNAIAASEASLRPRSRIGLQGSRDSDDVMVRTLTVNHVMRTHDAKRVWEFNLHAMRDKSPFAKDLQSGLTVRHQRLDWRMQPSFELGVADTLYGSVSVTPTKWPVTVSAGRVNWAQMAFNPRALQKGMAAWNIGVRAAADGRLGRLNIVADAYGVDDGNTVSTATIRYQPSLRLPLAVRPVMGFEHRRASFNTTDYWSPHEGYGLVYAGLEREWARGDRWQINASIQRGWRVYGEAGDSWGAGISGRVRVSKQWALAANAWGVDNSRSGRPYRARSVTVFLERRW